MYGAGEVEAFDAGADRELELGGEGYEQFGLDILAGAVTESARSGGERLKPDGTGCLAEQLQQ